MDRKFRLHSYFGVAYVVSMTVDMVLIKKIVTNVDLSTGVGVLQQRLGDGFVPNRVFHFWRLRAIPGNDGFAL